MHRTAAGAKKVKSCLQGCLTGHLPAIQWVDGLLAVTSHWGRNQGYTTAKAIEGRATQYVCRADVYQQLCSWVIPRLFSSMLTGLLSDIALDDGKAG